MMFLLDTNVLSEMMAVAPAHQVAAWISAYPLGSLCTASVCQAEILAGLAVMPDGRRRSALEAAAHAMFQEEFDGRVLVFDTRAAAAYAALFAARRRSGKPVATIDLMVASIARVHGASVVTRNVADFDGVGLDVINPWVA